MGKNHRHKKNLKSEKGKIKLKVSSKTKFLPKGLNVTDTAFKIKAIVLPKQLEEKSSSAPVSLRNLDVKELITRLKHYNENAKVSACEDIAFILKHHKTDLKSSALSEIIQNISVLIDDRERKVRKACVKVIETLLENFRQEIVAPYFSYFALNLKCAMTDIDKHVQEDSILFLDKFLKYTPSLVAKFSDKILPQTLSLISRLRNDSGMGRALTINLTSKHTSVGWRIKILSRLYAILDAIISERTKLHRFSGNVDVHNDVKCYDASSVLGKGVYKRWDALFNSDMNFFGIVHKTDNECSIIDQHLSTLVPLLYETWLEVAPRSVQNKGVTHLNEEAATLLRCVLNVFYMLWKYVEVNGQKFVNTICLSTDGEIFIKHFIVNFPYAQINRPKQLSDQTNELEKLFMTQTDTRCLSENCLICYMFLSIYVNVPKKITGTEIKTIESFVTRSLLEDFSKTETGSKFMLLVLRNLLIDNIAIWKKKDINLINILENTIVLYTKGNLSHVNQLEIFDILVNVTYIQFLENASYNQWLKDLPKLLLEKSIAHDVVNALLMLMKKNYPVFEEGFLNELLLILENISKIKIVGTHDAHEAKMNIINMLFFIPELNKHHMRIIEFFDGEDTEYDKMIKDVLKLREEFNR